jgi:hypothetical protein
MADTHVTGLKELNDFLQALPVKVERNILRGGLRSGMSVVKPVAQQNIHSVSGETAKGLKIGTRARGGTVTATLRATGKHAFVAILLELTGAKPHQITAKVAKALGLNGGAYASVNHPGFRKRPFLRPALDQQAQAALVATGEYIKNRLATKEGIDTSYVMIEGDIP